MNFINHRGPYGTVVHMNSRPLSGLGGSSLNGRDWRFAAVVRMSPMGGKPTWCRRMYPVVSLAGTLFQATFYNRPMRTLILLTLVTFGACACRGPAGASGVPIDHVQSLNGCYEGEGLPDFMRPAVHWTFRVADGVIFDRNGAAVSRINILGSTSPTTALSFSPGILIVDDEQKRMMVYPGPTVTGEAFLNGTRASIALADEFRTVMHTTSCR
jgi:hypothetical protein